MKKSIKRLSVAKVKAKIAKLKGERGTWESHWQEVTDHILPRKNTITSTKSDGQKRTWQLLDNTGLSANELLAGTLHGLLTNPDMPWFELTTGKLDIDSQSDVRLWLQQTARSMHNVLNNSNFQTEVHELYIDLGAIGTSSMQIEEDVVNVVRFNTRYITEFYIDESPLGIVDQVYREWKWNAAAIIEEFGHENVSKKVQKAFKDCEDTLFIVQHAVYPKYVVEPQKEKQEMQFISQYILPECDHEISVGEFSELPYVVPRFTKAAGEVYGRSPGMTALPELKVLNKMNETMLIGAQLAVQPPLQMEDDGVILPLITRPGGINYTRPGAPPIKPIFNDTRLDFGYQAMQDRRQRVKDAYFVDQLKLQQGGPMMTATEVLQRTEESMRLLGPLLGRMQNEFLRPLINRVFQIMWTRKLITQPPAALSGMKIDVKYSSLIAKSQRVTDAQSILRVLQVVPNLAAIGPAVVDLINVDNIVKTLSLVYGAPSEMLNEDKAIAEIRKARAEAQAVQAQNQQQAIQQQQQMGAVQTMKEAGLSAG